ncbi:MAG: hypothetical protein PHN59_06170 [Candidatus Omnitrophica bacterium]|nr:hypothetical protein [Candidatus Omnitrophota bacterium]
MNQLFLWVTGFLTAFVWSALNFFFTSRLLRALIIDKSKAKVLLILLVKFPVLYFVGYLVLASRRFPLSSILVGLIPILVIVGVMKLWPKRT